MNNKNKFRLKSGNAVHADSYWESNGPEVENVDTLNDLLTCPFSPWGLDDSFSPDAPYLKQLAIKDPTIISEKLIYSSFKSLRLVNKHVREVDEHLLRFHKLEELVLSVNKIRNVTSCNLPQTLKVLELCSNEISSLKDLCINKSLKLQHLGLAYNRIQCSAESTYLTGDFWPNLVSLDLSFNDLTDLFDLVPRLSTLPQLRILLLQGNPLTLVPAYRGYVIDSLPTLSVLDDIPILPDEKHQFTGFSNKHKLPEKKAQLTVKIENLQGIPKPLEQNPAEYPVITYSYFVTYEFIEDGRNGELEDNQATLSKQLHLTHRDGSQEMEAASSVCKQLPIDRSHTGHNGYYETVKKTWLELTDYQYIKRHSARDLLALKYFLLSGMKVTVTEEKILHWAQDPAQNVVPKPDKKGGGKEKDKGRSSSKYPFKKPLSDEVELGNDINELQQWMSNIPKCQLMRIRKNCSDLGKWKEQSQILKERFMERGYEENTIDKTIKEVEAIKRESLHKYKEKKCDENTTIEDPFITEYRYRIHNITVAEDWIIHEHLTVNRYVAGKKENVDELRPDPPIERTLGSVTISLESLVSGETHFTTVCNFGVLCTDTDKQEAMCEKETKKNKEKKLKSGRETEDACKTPRSASEKGKSKNIAEANESLDQPSTPPIPLTADIQIQITRWKSIEEAERKRKI
ncbi:leucine-rich repeat-containing protein 43 [Bombina bombina]|uniref:leucine-rich repeat-containing protein 43 n=1 Tax=Bombina bombina TaxID=8345 RepID=UPI00235B04E8|nr:leucine-rich repeat-containing protein 43 [Bombina bombina]